MEKKRKKLLTSFFLIALLYMIFSLNYIAYASNTSGSGSMEGTVSTDVFKVVLPIVPETSVDQNTPIPKLYSFLLDPNHLAKNKYPNMNIEEDATLLFNNIAGGRFDYSHVSDSLTVQNKSTMNVDVKLNVEVTGMNHLLTNDSAFSNDKNTSVYLAITDSNNKTSVIDKYGAFLRKTLSGKPEAYKYIVDKTNGKYKYVLKSDEELQANNIKFENYSFQLTGNCNSAGDWSEFVEPVDSELTVIWQVSPRPADLRPSIGKNSYVMTENIPNIVDIDLGEGSLAATGISFITYKDESGTSGTLGSGNYTFADDTLTFNASYISNLINAGITSRRHTVIFNDKAATRADVKLAVNDTAPSIDQTSYSMTRNNAVLADVNLGSGNLRATGIKSINFTNDAGVLKTLGTQYYKLTNGVLEFSASAINVLLDNGIASRTFIVNLNDKASTKWEITLSAEGTVPSIETKTYFMRKDSPVTIDVDLGTGYVAATAIDSIMFTNASGITKILEKQYYSFIDGTLEFTPEAVNILINGGITSRTYTIIFNNELKTRVSIDLNVIDIAPSIPENAYKMTRGQAVVADIDLGAGKLRATGIKSITFTNPSGIIKTLGNDYYVLSDNTLRFRASAVEVLLKGGIRSRDFTVTLNDSAATKGVITLYTDSTEPEIGTKIYSIRKNQAVSIRVNRGSGDLEANTVKSISFRNNAGVTTALDTKFYSFSNETLEFNVVAVNTLINNGLTSRTFTVAFDNISETRIDITLNIVDAAPVISSASYQMIRNQAVVVDVDLGAGNLRATGIKSITFINPSGVQKTLGTDYYVLADGKLRFRASAVNILWDGGIRSRTFTVTLNDRAGTHAEITLRR